MTRLRIARFLVALVAATACSTEWVNDPGDPVSSLFVSPLGPGDEWVTPTQIVFTKPDGATSAGVISHHQPFGESGPPGEWSVSLTPPAGWAPAPGHASPVRIMVPPDTTIDMIVRFAPESP